MNSANGIGDSVDDVGGDETITAFGHREFTRLPDDPRAEAAELGAVQALAEQGGDHPRQRVPRSGDCQRRRAGLVGRPVSVDDDGIDVAGRRDDSSRRLGERLQRPVLFDDGLLLRIVGYEDRVREITAQRRFDGDRIDDDRQIDLRECLSNRSPFDRVRPGPTTSASDNCQSSTARSTASSVNPSPGYRPTSRFGEWLATMG
nr:hypothetical protein [Haladaptatus halobius]